MTSVTAAAAVIIVIVIVMGREWQLDGEPPILFVVRSYQGDDVHVIICHCLKCVPLFLLIVGSVRCCSSACGGNGTLSLRK